jgi:ribonuclease J
MVHRTINRLFEQGAEVIYDSIAPVHVSGHASQEEMKMMLQLVRPKHFIPIHGELRHLKQHAILAGEIGIDTDRIAVIENGTIVEFQDGAMNIADRVPGGYVFVDGSGVGDIGPSVMREREALARDGFVIIHLFIDPKTGKLLRSPDITSKGFVFLRESEELFGEARKQIRELIAKADGGDIEAKIEKELSKFFYTETKRRPMIFVFLIEESKS